MAKITLFEFNPRGRIQIGPSGPDGDGLFSAEIDRADDVEEDVEADADESGGLSILTVLLPLVILAGIGVAVKALTGDEDDEAEELEEGEEGPIDRFTSTTE